MLKLLSLAILALSVSGMKYSAETSMVRLEDSPVYSMMYGFVYGLQLDPTTAATNPCLLQIASSNELKAAAYASFLEIYKGFTNVYSFLDVMRQFADAYNQEMNICKFPTLTTLMISTFSLSSFGEYVIKYVVDSKKYNGYIDDLKNSYGAGDYQKAGEDAGMIFQGLTNFYI